MNFLLHSITGMETAINVCHYLMDNAHQTVQQYLEDTDVINKLQYTQSVLYRLQHYAHSKYLSDPCHPVVVAITGVIDIVQLLRRDITHIRTINEKHTQQWFHTWYSPDDKIALKQLETHVKIHDLRVRRLYETLPFLETNVFTSSQDTDTTTLDIKPLERRHSI